MQSQLTPKFIPNRLSLSQYTAKPVRSTRALLASTVLLMGGLFSAPAVMAQTAPQIAKSAPAETLVTQTSATDRLQGAWRLQQGKYLDDKGVWQDYAALHLQAIKVIADGYFSFTTVKQPPSKSGIAAELAPTEFWAAGSGQYKLTDTQYTEYLSLNSFGAKHGQAFSFEYTLEQQGDKTLMHTKRIEKGQLKEVEVWQKL